MSFFSRLNNNSSNFPIATKDKRRLQLIWDDIIKVKNRMFGSEYYEFPSEPFGFLALSPIKILSITEQAFNKDQICIDALIILESLIKESTYFGAPGSKSNLLEIYLKKLDSMEVTLLAGNSLRFEKARAKFKLFLIQEIENYLAVEISRNDYITDNDDVFFSKDIIFLINKIFNQNYFVIYYDYVYSDYVIDENDIKLFGEELIGFVSTICLQELLHSRNLSKATLNCMRKFETANIAIFGEDLHDLILRIANYNMAKRGLN